MVVVGLVGPKGSGKKTVADLLVNEMGFRFASLRPDDSPDTGVGSSVDPAKIATSVLEALYSSWQENWVLFDVTSPAQLPVLQRRPLFYLIAVDAPVLQRFQRSHLQDSDLLQFVSDDDDAYYGRGLQECMRQADTTIVNNKSLEDLRQSLGALLPDCSEWVRPAWHTYFMKLAVLASSRSNCMKRRVGAIIVQDKRIVGTGYNGTPRGTFNCNEGGCGRCNNVTKCGEKLDECLCLHAEENAIMEVGRARCEGGSLYTTSFPCLSCAKKIVQAGITEVLYCTEYATDEKSASLLFQVRIKISRITLHLDKLPVVDCERHCQGSIDLHDPVLSA